MADLNGKKIAVIATNGFEDSELASPVEAVQKAGGEVKIISTESGTISGKNDTEEKVDLTTAEANAEDFDALILPGGTGNADKIRMDEKAVDFVRSIFDANKPTAVICHGAWILTDADVLKGRTLTSYASLKTDLKNAGATWVDEEVRVDNGLVSSRTPADLEAFNAALLEEFGK